MWMCHKPRDANHTFLVLAWRSHKQVNCYKCRQHNFLIWSYQHQYQYFPLYCPRAPKYTLFFQILFLKMKALVINSANHLSFLWWQQMHSFPTWNIYTHSFNLSIIALDWCSFQVSVARSDSEYWLVVSLTKPSPTVCTGFFHPSNYLPQYDHIVQRTTRHDAKH